MFLYWLSYNHIFSDALSDVLDALKEGENFQRLEEAKISAGNDMLRTMQIVFPVATNIQMTVIERYGFPPDGEGMQKNPKLCLGNFFSKIPSFICLFHSNIYHKGLKISYTE